MKKSLAVLLALILISGYGIFGANSTIGDTIDEVRFEEKVLYGDKSVAEGVTVECKMKYNSNTYYNSNMYWNTTYKIGEEPITQTDFMFYEFGKEDLGGQKYSEMEFDTYGRITSNMFNQFWEGDKIENPKGLELAYMELMEETPNGTTGCKDVYLKDYLDYYIFDLWIAFPEQSLDIQSYYLQTDEPKETDAVKVLEAFNNFFKIPVLEDEVCRIGINKNSKGEIEGYGFSTVNYGRTCNDVEIEEINYGDVFLFEIDAVYTEDTCYFTFSPKTWVGKLVDTSLIPGGYGIYSFKYSAETGMPDAESLKMIYALEPTAYVNLELDTQKENLLIFSEEEDECCLSVVDLDTLEKKQQIAYARIDSDESSRCYWIDDEVIVAQYTFDEAMIFSRNEDGTYHMEYTISCKEIEEYGEIFLFEESSLDWDGEKLLASSMKTFRDRYGGFYLMVFDKTGLIYLGEYKSSLDTAVTEYNYGFCEPVNTKPLEVYWN